MIDYGETRSTVKPESIVIDDFSVWQHTNIQEVSENVGEENEFVGYKFNMVQFEKDEFILRQAEMQKKLQDDVATARKEAASASQAAEAVSTSNRTAILAASFSAVAFTDEQAVQVLELYAEWSAEGVPYSAGERVRYGGGLYKCLSAHTSQESWTPADAPSLWGLIGAPDAGTKENPIAWATGMEAEAGKYYKDANGVLWHCIESSGVGLYGEPKDLARYFERAE